MVGWAEALGFHSCFPKGIRQGCGHSTRKETRSVASSIPLALSKPKDKALFLWDNLLQSLSSWFQALAGELSGWWDPIPTDTVEIQKEKKNPPSQLLLGGGEGAGPGPSLLTSGLIPLYTTAFLIKPSKSRTFYYYFCGHLGVFQVKRGPGVEGGMGEAGVLPPPPSRRAPRAMAVPEVAGGRHGNPSPPRPWRSRRTPR